MLEGRYNNWTPFTENTKSKFFIVHLTFNVIGLNKLNGDPDLPAMKMMKTVMKIILLLPNHLRDHKEFPRKQLVWE